MGLKMCNLCPDVFELPEEDALAVVANAMLDNSYDQDHLDEVVDKILDTPATEENPELDRAWEESRK